MVRRAVLIASVLGAVSAAAALALAPELTRVGRALTTRAPWRGAAFTPVPPGAFAAIHGSIGGAFPPGTDSIGGKYCRFPPRDEGGAEDHAHAALASASDSSALLTLQGESSVPRARTGEALCVGDSSGALRGR